MGVHIQYVQTLRLFLTLQDDPTILYFYLSNMITKMATSKDKSFQVLDLILTL